MTRDLSADDVIGLLGLVPLAGEGGLYRETWRLPASDPDEAPRATAIYYFLTPDTFSELHRLHADEVYHAYLGDPVELTQLGPDGETRTVTLGSDIAGGMAVQHVVPAGTWQGSRLVPGGSWALLGTTMTPGFDPDRYEQGRHDDLVAQYPGAAATIRALTRV